MSTDVTENQTQEQRDTRVEELLRLNHQLLDEKAELYQQLRDTQHALDGALEDKARAQALAETATSVADDLQEKLNNMGVEYGRKIRDVTADQKLQMDAMRLQLDKLGYRSRVFNRDVDGRDVMLCNDRLEKMVLELRVGIRALTQVRDANSAIIMRMREKIWELENGVQAQILVLQKKLELKNKAISDLKDWIVTSRLQMLDQLKVPELNEG
jgi:hypothetical protein